MENVQDIYGLSPMQHGMLFDSVTVGDLGMYLIQLEYALEGAVRVEAFEAAWQAAVDRHGVLRSSYHWDELKDPLQVVHEGVKFPLAVHDWRDVPASEHDHRMALFCAEDRDQGVDFEEPPLMRLALVRLGESSWRLLWSFHHILMEGWSASLVLGEVMQHYRCSAAAEPLVLAEHRPYRDYVTWFQEQDPQLAKDFWRALLAGYEGPTHLGIDRDPKPLHEPVVDFEGKV
ncbi:MAG: surfactin family lipopeptide synthetase C, partial [Pseudohongiellaceae bacterium]